MAELVPPAAPSNEPPTVAYYINLDAQPKRRARQLQQADVVRHRYGRVARVALLLDDRYVLGARVVDIQSEGEVVPPEARAERPDARAAHAVSGRQYPSRRHQARAARVRVELLKAHHEWQRVVCDLDTADYELPHNMCDGWPRAYTVFFFVLP